MLYIGFSGVLIGFVPLTAIIISYFSFYLWSDKYIQYDDNTSGLVACILLAELLLNYKDIIKLVFFDNEEKIRKGSEEFIKNNSELIIDRLKVLNLDCVGRGKHIAISFSEGKILKRKNEFKSKFLLFLELKKIYHLRSGSSRCDCKSFAVSGFDAFTLHRAERGMFDTINLGWPHSQDDKLEHINIKYLLEIVLVAQEFILQTINDEK